MGFFHDLKLKRALRAVQKQHPNSAITGILASRPAFRKFANDPPSFMTASAEFTAFQADPSGKIGDGTLLKLFLDNLPALIAALMSILALFPKKMEAFNWQHFLDLIGKEVPIFADVIKDSVNGMSITDLLAKYGEEGVALVEDIVAELKG